MADEFKEVQHDKAQIFGQFGTKVSLQSFSMRELILGAVVIFTVIICLILASLLGVAKHSNPSASALSGNLGGSCSTKLCLESAAYILANLNTSVDPCDNFHQYACGGWKTWKPIRPDRQSRTTLNELYYQNRQKLRVILEGSKTRVASWSSEVKLKDLYASCMDDYTTEKLKGSPFIKKVLPDMGGWAVLGTWNPNNFNLNKKLKIVQEKYLVQAFYRLAVIPDWADRTKRVVGIYPAGTGRYMPWYYYVSPQTQKVRTDYKKFMTRVSNFLVRDSGVKIDPAIQSRRITQFVNDAFEIEVKVARAALYTRWARNPYTDENKVSLDTLSTQTQNVIDWTGQVSYLFDKANVNHNTKVVVFKPDFLRNVSLMISQLDPTTKDRKLHSYLTWRIMETYVQDMSWEYVHANREMYVDIWGRVEFLGKFRYCFFYVNRKMPEALSSLFIADHFEDKNIKKITEITENIKKAIKTIMWKTPWMDDATRKYAEDKLNVASYKLGYQDFLTDQDKVDEIYKTLTINKTDFFQNKLELNKMDKAKWNKELREGEDRNSWYYSAINTNLAVLWYWNEVIAPAGILQFPLYDHDEPHAMSFGSIGSIMGHFILHIIDEYGRRWDKTGKYMGRNTYWWTNATNQAYLDVKQCMVNFYSNRTQGPYVDPDGKTVNIPINANSFYTEGISITDGMKVAYYAYHDWQQTKGADKPVPTGLGLTNDQIFFISAAQTFCANKNAQASYNSARYGYPQEDVRINMAVSQLKEFSDAFKCKATSRMNPANKCQLY
ncbi:endothelin-converting enzyme homolog [Gigantopelta aegis]|uniref:endothelin-converting enzyme homolog n=1 Tax=Gigantopelta aegis TaxID=1735272 RepID=UPI001B889B85|nr:endothelin-converting enzyme homolog [Gigantopelta aegis]